MQVRQSTPQTFRGYDARRLRALCMTTTSGGVASELFQIGKKVGFDVYVAGDKTLTKMPVKKGQSALQTVSYWAQDTAFFSPNGNIVGRTPSVPYQKLLSKKFKKDVALPYGAPEGGNLFYIRDENGKNILLAGNSLKKNSILSTSLENIFGVDKIDYIPQMDFHIDLFVRPLDNKNVLIADDNLTLDYLKKTCKKIDELSSSLSFNILKKIYLNYKKASLNRYLKMFQNTVSKNQRPHVDSVVSVLENKGYTVHRVPGRLYWLRKDNTDLVHDVNYMNAIVTKNRKGELVYITNKSTFDDAFGLNNGILKEIGVSFEDEFANSLSSFIKKENIYFVKGEQYAVSDFLTNYSGGIHCLTMEIPK